MIFSKEQIKKSISILDKCLPDKDVSNGILFQPFSGTKVKKDFTRKALKRVNVFNTIFETCIFVGVAATGSKFSNSKFRNCNFSGSNFQYCFFNNVSFDKSTNIKSANFSHSVFVNCKFSNISIIESTLLDCSFENCKFLNSEIRTDTLENTSILNSYISNIDLAHINLEYMRVDNTEFNNVILPPYQIPYIIGLPSYLLQTKDDIYIYTDNGKISKKDYCMLYNNLTMFFYRERNFFPMANICIADNNDDKAYEYIKLGIEEASDYSDFRMIKHFCRLACSNKRFSYNQIKKLYDLVTDLSYQENWDINTLHSYMLNIGEIKEILLNNYEYKQRVEFVIKTNIEKDNLDSINVLYNRINHVLRETCSAEHIESIELRHNSPYELYVTCIDYLPYVLMLISTIYSFFMAGDKVADFIKKIKEISKIHRENKLLDLEIKEKELDIMIKKQKINKGLESKMISPDAIVEIEHILKCNSRDLAKQLDTECLHNKINSRF